MSKETNLDDIDIEAFADIYEPEQEKKIERKGLLDDLEPDVSIEEIEDADKAKEETKETEQEKGKEEEETQDPSIQDLNSTEETEETKNNKSSEMAAAMRYMVESGKLFPFDDEKPLDDYTDEDWKELWDANMNDLANGTTNQAFKEDFENLSPEAQMLIEYERNGGRDSKSMMSAILNAKTTYDLDISNAEGQRNVVRAYYQKKHLFKNAETLEKELDRLEDAGDLEEKANEFKPMLQELQNAEIEQQMAINERNKRAIQNQLQAYNQSIFNTLNTPDLNGIHITKRTKDMLYDGLTSNGYKTASGKRTNLLYHLLEEKQYIHPDHPLIAEVTWLLADPKGYKTAVANAISQQITAQTANKIKNEQQGRSSNTVSQEPKRTVKRPVRSLFER